MVGGRVGGGGGVLFLKYNEQSVQFRLKRITKLVIGHS